MQPDQKVGRNDPCPCGSGKKYKKCCEEKHIHKKFDAQVISPGNQQVAKVQKLSSLFQRVSPPKPKDDEEPKNPIM
jgi:hypothetical protein